MNKFGNIRSTATKEKIHNALMYLLKRKKFEEIYVKDICKIACINRSSFYEHYQDINDLMTKTEAEFSRQMGEIFADPPNFDKGVFQNMFQFIYDHRDFYSVYLSNNDNFMEQTDFKNYLAEFSKSTQTKSKFKENEMIFHMAFFAGGLKAICKVWITQGMKETPEEMAEILRREYDRTQIK